MSLFPNYNIDLKLLLKYEQISPLKFKHKTIQPAVLLWSVFKDFFVVQINKTIYILQQLETFKRSPKKSKVFIIKGSVYLCNRVYQTDFAK